MPYSYVTFGQLKAALLQRLQDTLTPAYTTSTGFGFTDPTEAGLYLIEALQVLNSQVAVWNADYVLDFSPGDTWKSLNVAGSPRVRTVTDTDILTLMEYHLLEPPSGSTWTGTTQFNIIDLAQALQYRRDELLQASGANVVTLTQPSPTAGYRSTLPDVVLALRRVRWVPVAGASYPLWREDRVTADAFGGQLTTDVRDPESWLITANAPLQFDVDAVPPVPGTWDMLAFEPGAALAPPATTVLGLPDDWCWVAKWGALADVLSNSPEGADQLRARYCLERYKQGTKAMLALPWLLDANVAAVTVDTPSVEEADAYAQNWEVTWPIADPQLVVGGVDILAIAPFVTVPNPLISSVVTVVGNAPVPVLDADPIQLSRDGVDAVLAYAQHLAMFKMGGSEFTSSIPLLAAFEAYCARENSRYRALGVMRTDLITEGSRTLDIDPRLEDEGLSREDMRTLKQQVSAWKEASA
jgi:hypothetical protein